MCGLVGGIWRDGVGPDRSVARLALDCIAHRGPDAESALFADGLFLGHQRLSIIDLDVRSTQPMTRGALTIVYNGEIYNYRALRSGLEARGVAFRTESDTEVILAAFELDGRAALQGFEGMYAFALWDAASRRLTLARDRFGEKPLVYLHDSDRFLFSSEVQGVQNLAGDSTLVGDKTSLSQYFRFTYYPAPLAPFHGMRQLEPGCWVELDVAGWSLDGGRHYKLTPQARPGIGFDAAKKELRQRLEASVDARLTASDVPVATFLSGGLDSSIVATLAARQAGRISAYSVAFPEDPDFDESGYARLVAAGLPQVDHHVIDVTENALMEFVSSTLATIGEPYADSSIIPTAFLCAKVEEKVILGGDGADEIFAGYGVYDAITTSARLPAWLRRVVNALPSHPNPVSIANPRLRALALAKSHIAPTLQQEYLSWRSYASADDLRALGLPATDLPDPLRWIETAPMHDLRQLLAADISFNMAADMLKKVDLASMQHGVEVRAPYLDSGLVEFALSLPAEFLISGRTRKHILREAFRDDLPPAILGRRKQGFLLPLRTWFKTGRIRDELDALARDSAILDSGAILRLAEQHATGRRDNASLLWSIYVFLKWVERHPDIDFL